MYDWRIECYERAIAFAETRGIPLEPLEQFGHLEHFHYGGAAACREWVYHLDIAPDDRVLDIGCGVGGTGRYMWREIGCSYDGVDVRADFVAFAVQLGERMAYDGLRFHHIDAQSDPLPPCDVAIAALSLGQMDGARCLENLARALSDRSRYLIEMIVERKSEEQALLENLTRFGFATPRVYDLTERWREWTAVRLERFLSNREFFVELYGEATTQDRADFYEEIAHQFAIGTFRGVRVTPREKSFTERNLSDVAVVEFDMYELEPRP